MRRLYIHPPKRCVSQYEVGELVQVFYNGHWTYAHVICHYPRTTRVRLVTNSSRRKSVSVLHERVRAALFG